MKRDRVIDLDWSVFETDEPQRIAAVMGKGRLVATDGSVVCAEVAVVTQDSGLRIRVDQDYDELEVSAWNPSRARRGWKAIPEMQDIVGCELGWSWEGRNDRGYWDMFCLAVNALDLRYAFVGMGGSISILRLWPLKVA